MTAGRTNEAVQVVPNWHKNGKRGTMTDDYKPNGMTTLFAALNIP
jgi:hypothetical protein